MTDLTNIKNYWANKYPNVEVRLWANDEVKKYYGKMLAANNASVDLKADTIGELISQGENFLRKYK